MKPKLGLLITLAALLLAAPAAGRPAALACGDVVTDDITLHASLTGCTTGLVVGADDVTVDLNGHTILGTGRDTAGNGIEAFGRSGVIVRNGLISGFDTGVLLSGASSSTVENLRLMRTNRGVSIVSVLNVESTNVIRDNVVTSSLNGIVVIEGAASITGNRLIGLSNEGVPGGPFSPRGVGVYCFGGVGTTVIEDNVAVGSTTGIFLFRCRADVSRNTLAANTGNGIERLESPGSTERNRANANGGNGILAFDSHGGIFDNVANANGGDGIRIEDSIPSHGPLFTVGGNLANANHGYGLSANVVGVEDAGGNHAHANGAVTECLLIACN